MPGKITRLLACTEEQRKVYPQSGLDMGPTFVHPNYVNNPHNHESSGSYNKPASVMHWVREAQIDEMYILFIDADMLLRAPIDPVALGVRKGLVVSEHVAYLDQGISRHLPENFLPDPDAAFHFAKAAGWYHIFHLDDLKAIAPRWLHYTERMRSNPQLYWDMNGSKAGWHPLALRAIGKENYIKTGDDYVHFGEAPWISEMYGYVMAASEQRIDTKLLHGLVEYTDWHTAAMPPQGPSIIHYGLHCHVNGYHFTKYDYTNFNIGSCPNLFFRLPEVPSSHQALCAETINTLNDALCDFYRTRCPGSEDLQCAPHVSDGKPLCENVAEDCLHRPNVAHGHCGPNDLKDCRQACTQCCGDTDARCLGWAFGGECDRNPGFMRDSCRLSCRSCPASPPLPSAAAAARDDQAAHTEPTQGHRRTVARAQASSRTVAAAGIGTLANRRKASLAHERIAAGKGAGVGIDSFDGGVADALVAAGGAAANSRIGDSAARTAARRWTAVSDFHPSEGQLVLEVCGLGLGATLLAFACLLVRRKRPRGGTAPGLGKISSGGGSIGGSNLKDACKTASASSVAPSANAV